jgi:hypothetical protein
MAKPKLQVTHKFENGVAFAWRCSACRENIDKDQPPNQENTVEAAFALHVKQKHSHDDVNQSAARIVRGATDIH